ncbi:YaeQ family protein [Andreprevotia chitinilytica]|uniref:YaeQ family protein n=1 Tax=Andreprevotia chitinilytica TaxID=396808 RepID=UPI0005551043|nr:YaeQ family protein [Andreprevotia chitinilytica]
MALKATIYKADLNIADMDRGYYGQHSLTIARHPSETDERMMLRVLAFARHASDTLEFGRGISDEEDAAVWQKNLVDEIELWIELGLPDEKRLRKACNRAAEVWLYAYGGRTVDIWWDGIKGQTTRFDHLHVLNVAPETLTALGEMAERSMQLQATIQDGQLWLSNDKTNLLVELTTLK